MMNGTTRIVIEWRHVDLGQPLCGHCSDTGANLWEAVTTLGQENLLDGVELEIENTILPPKQLEESNVVLINGIPVEKIVDPGLISSGCSTCQVLNEKTGPIHTAAPGRDVFKAIPAEVLREAILKALRKG
jgi:hypothetical protein